MARRLAGSIRAKQGAFEASVPQRRGSTVRVYAYFATRAEAARWCAAAVDGLHAGRTPVPPTPAPAAVPAVPAAVAEKAVADGGHAHFFARGAQAWHTERYVQMRTADPGRARQTESHLQRHIVPFFVARTTEPGDLTRDLVIQFLLRLTGSREACFTVTELAAMSTHSKRTIDRMVRSGELLAASSVNGEALIRLGAFEDAVGAPRFRIAYSRSTVKGIMSTFRQVETYLVACGVIERAVSTGLPLPRIDPAALMRVARAERECVELGEVARAAGQLHIVHQLVLWLMRICGLRISEAYGIRVGDIFDDGAQGGHGLIAIERQGGRGFLSYDDNGHIVTTDSLDRVKTPGSVRVLVVPHSLMILVRLVVDVFHTDPATARVDLDARLVPGLQRPSVGGQGGFRTALIKAVRAANPENESEVESMFRPHDLRAALITALSETEVADIVRRKYAGHVPGTDVHAGYIRRRKGNEAFVAVADETERDIIGTIGGVVIPTERFPQFGRAHPISRRLDEVRCHLVEAGSLLEIFKDGEPLLDAREAAIELGCHPSHVRRMIRSGVLQRELTAGQGRVAQCDVEALLDARLPNLQDLSEQMGVAYHVLHRMISTLDLSIERDSITGDYAVDVLAHSALAAEVERLGALRARSCTVVDAARLLHKAHSTVRKLIRQGELSVDGETDASGARYITHCSIQRYLERH